VVRSALVERSSRSSTLAIAAFVVAVVATALVASVPGSPLHPVMPPGVEPEGPFRWLAGWLAVDELGGSALVAATVAALFGSVVAFVFVVRAAWRGEVSLRTTVILAVVAHAVVIVLPLLVSRDVYSYIAYGNIAGLHHANPYIQTPIDFPNDAVSSLVGPAWFSTPAVYGPLFTGFAAVVVRAVDSVQAQVEVFRWTALCAGLGTVAVIATTVRRAKPSRAAFAVAAFGMNPVVLYSSVASGHNDLLVAFLVAVALALLLAGHDRFAVVALTLATAVKVVAGLPLLLLVVWCTARAPTGRRLRTFVSYAGMAAAIWLVCAAPFLNRHDPSLGVFELAGHEGWLAPYRFFRRLLDALSGDTLGVAARIAFAALLLAVIVLLVREVWRLAQRTDDRRASASSLGAAWGWSLLLLMLLGPTLLPWYVTWALPLVWLLPRAPRVVLLGTSVALGVSQWTAEPTRFRTAYDVNLLIGHYVITPVVIGLAAWLLVDGWKRWRGGPGLQDEQDVADPPGKQGDDRGAHASGER
jgi:alpha-1,6-mannosyltransferase